MKTVEELMSTLMALDGELHTLRLVVTDIEKECLAMRSDNMALRLRLMDLEQQQPSK